MPDTFYFRIRGEVKGPFSREHIISLVRKKRLGRHHELSADGVNWQRAGELEELFDSPGSDDRVVLEPVEEFGPVSTEPIGAALPQRSSIAGQPTGGPDDWFYAKGRSTHGPVSSKDLRNMLVTGRVDRSDRIWNQSLSDWIPAADVVQIMESVQESDNPHGNPPPERQKSSRRLRKASFFEVFFAVSPDSVLSESSSTKFPNLCRYLSISESVFRVLLVVQIFAATAWYAFVMFGLFQVGTPLQIAFGLFIGAAALTLAIAVLWFAFLASMAMLDILKVMLRIEDNTTR